MMLVPAVRKIVTEADSNQPLSDVRTQTQQIEQILSHEPLLSRLSSFFAVPAMTLACIGLYGLLSYEVARRTRELGIRVALGPGGAISCASYWGMESFSLSPAW